MLNRLFLSISLIALCFSCDYKKTGRILKFGNEQLTLYWEHYFNEISTVEPLILNFTLEYPLGTSTEIKTVNSGEFTLIDITEEQLAPPHPNKLKTRYQYLFEPPEPGDFDLPILRFTAFKNGSVLASFQSPEGNIKITSINPSKDFTADHIGDLKRRPSKWLLLSLIFFAMPFIHRKRKIEEPRKETLNAEDVENCHPDYESLEALLLKIVNQEIAQPGNDLSTGIKQLSTDHPFHLALQSFILEYRKARYSAQGKNAAELISELNKIYRRRKQ